MRRAILRSAVMLVALLGLAAPAAAGGFATVRLDEPPGEVVVDVPWQVGFTVKQHDVTPTNDVQPVVQARHKETGEEIRASARQTGAVGHFLAQITFPRAGAWKWTITPAPFSETSFETLTVLAEPGLAPSEGATILPVHPAQILQGTCAAPGPVAFPLTDLGSPPPVEPTSMASTPAAGVASHQSVVVAVTTLHAPLADLATGERVIRVQQSTDQSDIAVACGAIGGPIVGTDLVVGLQPEANLGQAGVAVLHGTGDQTIVTLYLIPVSPLGNAGGSPAGPGVTIEIVGRAVDAWIFRPASLTVTVGTTVTWTNTTNDAHTVTGSDLQFEDSGPIDPGQSFSQTFTAAGTYTYRCGPHPWMTGIIVVE